MRWPPVTSRCRGRPRRGSGCRSRGGFGESGIGLSVWACPPRSRACARPRCPTARRTDPDRPAGRPSGATRRPGRTRGHSGDDRVPLPVRSRQLVLGDAHPCHPAQRFYKKTTMSFFPTRTPDGLPAVRSRSIRHAAGQHGRARARERGDKEAESALSRSRSDFSTKIHILADRRVRPLCLRVTGASATDSTRPGLGWKPGTRRSQPALPDRRPGHDGDAFRAWLVQQGIEAVIPVWSRRTNPSPTTRNGTKHATPWNGASAGSNAGGAWRPAMTNTRSVS